MKKYCLLLFLAAFAACSDPVAEPPADAADEKGRASVTFAREGGNDIEVYAFREQDGAFLFDTLINEGWSDDGRLKAKMRRGRYKFLFACGQGANLRIDHSPLIGQTAWDEAVFTLRGITGSQSAYAPADELFLQYPAEEAAKVYEVGSGSTVAAQLSRAVSRIGVTVKRGYHDGTQYVEVPFTGGRSALDEIERVELTALNAGSTVTPFGSGGSAEVTASLAAADYTELTPEGFVRLDGPFVIPPAEGADLTLELKVVPAEDSAPQTIRLTGRAERNRRLEVTLWITSDSPAVGVEIGVEPIEREQEGDSGMWE